MEGNLSTHKLSLAKRNKTTPGAICGYIGEELKPFSEATKDAGTDVAGVVGE